MHTGGAGLLKVPIENVMAILVLMFQGRDTFAGLMDREVAAHFTDLLFGWHLNLFVVKDDFQ